MVTAAALLAADPEQILEAAGHYRVAAAALLDRGDELDAATTALRSAWSGKAQRSALAALAAVRVRLTDATMALNCADQALSEFAESVAVARRLLSNDALGGVGRSLRMAEAADADATRRLASVSGWFSTQTELAVSVPPVGTAPASVAGWWSGLSAAEQRFVITERPADLVALDGVPADARDDAGRLLLRIQEAELRARRADLAADHLSTRSVNAELDGLDRLESRLDDPYAPARAYLLDVDAPRDRVVVAFGNPDRATDVATLVDGLGSGLPNVWTGLSDANGVWDAASAAAAPGHDVATVGWLDYDAPHRLSDAMSTGAAHDAAEPLSRFVDGLTTTHNGSAPHESLIGYSYGSTVVGTAAHSQALPVDDIVLIGSPGVDVDRAADLGVDPSHVWATTAAGDPVRLARDPLSAVTDAFAGHTPTRLWFGTDPTSADFGGQVFASNPGSWRHPIRTHMDYFDEGSRSLTNIGDIVAGRPPTA